MNLAALFDQPFNTIIFFLWVFSALFDYAEFTYIWQLKEYRMDRFFNFLQTWQGKHFWLRVNTIWRIPAVLLGLFWPLNNTMLLKQILVGIFTADIITGGMIYLKKRFKHPVWTLKAMVIMSASMFIEGGLILLARDWGIVALLLVLRFFILSSLIYVLSFPTDWMKQWYIRRATAKIKKYPQLTIVGITGSYGKSSVKECLAHILSMKYRVVKTPKNVNTEIGIAKFILQTNFRNADVCVVEMGAYTKGEIKLIASMVRPSIGVLTTIAEQHLALFGSIQNTQQAKYELLRALPRDGYAVTNADNPYCIEFLDTLLCKKRETFGREEANHPTYLMTDMGTTEKGIVFALTIDGVKEQIEACVIGEHQALNITPALMVAQHLGITQEEMRTSCATLPSDVQGSIRVYPYGKATIIDDSYNSNPAGFRAALDMLNAYPSKRKRIVVTRGMLELGSVSDEKHEEIAGEIAFVADELILISKDFEIPVRRGLVDKYHTEMRVVDEAGDLLARVKKLRDTDAVILLENRIPSLVYEEIIKAGKIEHARTA